MSSRTQNQCGPYKVPSCDDLFPLKSHGDGTYNEYEDLWRKEYESAPCSDFFEKVAGQRYMCRDRTHISPFTRVMGKKKCGRRGKHGFTKKCTRPSVRRKLHATPADYEASIRKKARKQAAAILRGQGIQVSTSGSSRGRSASSSSARKRKRSPSAPSSARSRAWTGSSSSRGGRRRTSRGGRRRTSSSRGGRRGRSTRR